MVENHRAAVTALPTGEGDTPVTRCPDRRTGAGGVIDALMGTHNAQDRVFARGGKPRTDARELDWHAQEAFLYRAAFVIVIADLAVAGDITVGGIFAALVDEGRGNDIATEIERASCRERVCQSV